MSVFLRIDPASWVASNDLAFAVRDKYEVSPGHTLVITKRVVPDWFSATREERAAVFALVDEVKRKLDTLQPRPDGYNVGFNAGEAAGQTVPHLHVHVIPRYRGDMDDPRGGVRHVIPSKGNYLRRVEALSTGGAGDPFARHLTPLFREAVDIAIVAAFIQESGLKHLLPDIHSALRRGARIRIITGDYLDITQASALEMLLDWQQTSTSAGDERPSDPTLPTDDGEPVDADDAENEPPVAPSTFEARVIETRRLPPPTAAFHPKSWRFEAPSFGVAFVGSSNISRSALVTGIEWNLRVDRDRDEKAYTSISKAFEALWRDARTIDSAWIADYAQRARERAALPSTSHLPTGEAEPEPLAAPPEPHDVQREALAALRASRDAGRARALVVLATGLGKTWLAAFDFEQFAADLASSSRPPRLLFVAHRHELLRQAAHTYRRLLRKTNAVARVGWFVGEDGDLSADIVFASVAKLSRKQHLPALKAQSFDYVVIDEVHHAAADSYRKILDAVSPRFLLGLTATPDRADEADVLGLFDDHIAYRADIPRGVTVGRLVPFHYFGVKDEIDYDNIPWRNKRFEPEALASAVQTEARMATLWRAWQAHPGKRSLIFCCSIAHADFVKAWLVKRNVRVAAVYAAPGSDDREKAIRQLEAGEIDALCSVDVFNEGVDVPSVDRVVMLRPTESSVIFLQQLGRGLRACPGKEAVSVIDFVGNHRVFLERLRTLLSLGGSTRATPVRDLLEAEGEVELPAGCSVDLELEAKDLLARMFKAGGATEVERVYRELRASRGVRPTAGEMERLRHLPSTLRNRYASWFGFVEAENDLRDDEVRVLRGAGGAFLRELEKTQLTKCFKLITVQALLDADATNDGLSLTELADRSHAILRRSPELFEDVAEDFRKPTLDAAGSKAWLAYWKRNPVDAWTTESKDKRAWFRLAGDRFVPAFAIASEDRAAFRRLAREMVDYRLAQYRARQRQDISREDGFVCRVTWNQRDPILKLPQVRDHVPQGEADIRVDGGVWTFRFAKEFCNVAYPAGGQRNQLPDLLRRWFGPTAGQPGTAFEVRFYASPDGLWAEPLGAKVIELPRNAVVAYPDLQAAAGHGQDVGSDVEAAAVQLPLGHVDPDQFAVRVSGTSMDGGPTPLRDGDWAVMRLARGASPSSVRNRVVLVRSPGEGDGVQYQIKRLVQENGRWRLKSDNPDGPSFDASDANTVIARLDASFHPEDLAPPVGTVLAEDEAATAFGVETLPQRSGRSGGHLFVLIDRKGMLSAPDLVREASVTTRPSETAFVLARREDGHWRYLGVGRWVAEEQGFRIPHADFTTWRTWGEGRLASRDLPEGALGRAQVLVDELLALPETERWFAHPKGTRARVLGPSARGGVRISGGEAGFEERTVSLVDLAWVVTAADDAQAKGELLDEARVNRLRYLEGTPKGSTRWIDTGWALGIWNKMGVRVRKAAGGASEPRKPRDDSGREVDATFSVEPVGTGLSVVFESRGGTGGTKRERNTEYAEGLRVVLERLAARGYRLADAQVISRETASLPNDALRLIVKDMPYPIRITDAEAARKRLSGAMSKVGQAPGAKGGNPNKRIRLWLEGPEASAADLATWLAEGERSSGKRSH